MMKFTTSVFMAFAVGAEAKKGEYKKVGSGRGGSSGADRSE